MTRDFEARERAQARKTFTSWKLDLLDGIAVDPRLKPFDFQLAYVMLQHMNADTGLLYPSQQVLAVLLDKDPRHVRRAISNLLSAGWLQASRPRRHSSNQYEFQADNVERMRGRRDDLMQQIAKMRTSDRTQMSSQTGHRCPLNTLR